MQKKEINSDGTKRTLSNRHVQMMAIGGTIGTGLFLGSGSTIAQTGPSILFIYIFLGIIFYFMMRAIGEMLYSDPSRHTFISFITKYLGFGTGLFAGWTYWLALLFGGIAELTAISIYVKFWFPNLNSAIIELSFIILLTSINVIAAKIFGETEFWLALIKIIAIISLIIVGIFMIIIGFKDNNGITSSFSNITNKFQMFPNGFHSFISAIPMVFFAFLAMEFISITIGETKNPRPVLKKAVKEIVFRILIFYIGALLIIMAIIPWKLISPDRSPFVQVFKIIGLPAAATVINFVVLTSAASSLNSILFSSGRHLYQLATEINSNKIKSLRKISKNGVPSLAIILSSLMLLIAPIISLIPSIKDAFQFVSAIGSDLYIFVYVLIMVSHIKYRKSKDFMSNGFKMPLYKWTNPIVIFSLLIVFITLFYNQNDVIPALSSIIWIIVFGGGCLLIAHGKQPANINN